MDLKTTKCAENKEDSELSIEESIEKDLKEAWITIYKSYYRVRLIVLVFSFGSLFFRMINRRGLRYTLIYTSKLIKNSEKAS